MSDIKLPTVTIPPQLQALQPTRIAVPKLALPSASPYPELAELCDAQGKRIRLDGSQLAALGLADSRTDFSIIGKAGTGKSTLMQAVCLAWIARHYWTQIEYRLKGQGKHVLAPSIAIVAYTNTATSNIYRKLMAHPELKKVMGANVTTVNNLLEYTVEFITDDEGRRKPRYFPKRTKENKLQITHLVLEEASMLGVGDVSLWQELFDAMPDDVQIVLLGDINQLPPVIGKSILSYALQQIPVAELDTPHRTALDNPIIRQALNCIEGKEVVTEYSELKKLGVRVLHGKQKIKVSASHFEIAFLRLIGMLMDAGSFDPYTDMILSPYFKENTIKGTDTSKAVSAMNIAKGVASMLAKKENKLVSAIQAGYVRKYLAVGDRVFADKVEGKVKSIAKNSLYSGKLPKPAAVGMDYYGNTADAFDFYDYSNIDIDADIEDEERKRSASHVVEIETLEGNIHICSSLSDFASLHLGYALSVHKAQGSEWPNVVIALHDTNAALLFRELVYTAMTRAKQSVTIVAQKHVLDKAIAQQRIKGNTLKEKIEFFNGGYLDQIVPISKRPQQKGE